MNAQSIRTSYLDYFSSHDHKVIPRALLVPQNDPSTLFTGSGMQPLIPYLLGEEHPSGVRLVDSQACLRAQDIDEVGDNRHTTFFEMLGNWSLGDYGKAEQLPWLFEFLTDVVGLDPQNLFVTCFIGDEVHQIPKDIESANIWKQLFSAKQVPADAVDIGSEEEGYDRGMQGGRIFFYNAGKNWWCRAGSIDAMPEGEPGGPDSEIFYRFYEREHTDHERDTYGELCHPNCDCGQFMEIGNSVFMEYLKTEQGFQPLPKKNVDFGGGLERIAAAALNDPDVFKISILWPIVSELESLSGKTYDSHTESMRVIADHLRAATFLAVDGTVPTNKEQGYVMRRLVRRAIKKAFDLGIEQNFLERLVPVIMSIYAADFEELAVAQDAVIQTLAREEKLFRRTLRKGVTELTKLADKNKGKISGKSVFLLHDTFGYPIELTTELIGSNDNMQLDTNWQLEFNQQMETQRNRSRTATKGEFKGGLGGQTVQHKKYHTATHLMYQSLRTVLGDHVIQHGSNITEERLRFDFSHPEKVTPEQLREVEAMVNAQIEKDLLITFEEHPTKIALGEMHVLGAFGDRYGDIVRIYRMQGRDEATPFSLEICGGPHVDHTNQLAEDNKHFKIIKEESSSAGIRRIKAVLV